MQFDSERLHTVMDRQDVLEASLPNAGAGVRAAIIAKGVLLEQDRIVAIIERAGNGAISIEGLLHEIKGETND